ncbi:MAG: DsbA family protein, partial [Deltaproteobacteria bacterium]|nr:DsbA family protein [Deltaproteobacteria bacterium]
GSALATALVATGASGYLTYAYFKVRDDAGWQSLCDVSAQFSCGAVAASDYSAAAGVPIAWVGVVFYAALSWFAWRSLRRTDHTLPRSPALALALAGAWGSALSVALALLSALVIRSFCPLCVVLYACNALLLGLGVADLRHEHENLRELLRAERRTWNRHLDTAALMVLAALAPLVALPLLQSMQPPLRGLCEYLSDRGGAKTLLVVYTDYQCPFCKKADLTLERASAMPGVELAVRNYPLDRECNTKLTRTIHPGACLQASAVLCAESLGRAKEFRRGVFDGGAKDRETLTALAASLGIDPAAFRACLASPDTASRLANDIESAREDGVHATPALFVDGRQYKGSLDPAAHECLAAEPGPAQLREALAPRAVNKEKVP